METEAEAPEAALKASRFHILDNKEKNIDTAEVGDGLPLNDDADENVSTVVGHISKSTVIKIAGNAGNAPKITGRNHRSGVAGNSEMGDAGGVVAGNSGGNESGLAGSVSTVAEWISGVAGSLSGVTTGGLSPSSRKMIGGGNSKTRRS